MMRFISVYAFAAAALAFAPAAPARGQATPVPVAFYVVGDLVEPIDLEDQHGAMHRLDEGVRLVLFHRDMGKGADALESALAEGGAGLLERARAAYLADIQGMPALISRMFALPAMRRRGYAMWLDRDGTRTARLPSQAGKVTLLELRALRVLAVSYADTAEAVRAALDAAAARPD
jgi:hypothetical protein